MNGATFAIFGECHPCERESVCVCVCVCERFCVCCLYFPPNPTSFTSSKMLKCANLQHDTFSMKRKKKKKKRRTVSEVLRFLPFHVHAHKSSACNAWTMSAALRLIRRMLSLRITLAAFVLFIPTSQCLTSNGTVCTQALLCDILCMLDLHSWYVCVMTGSAIPFCCLFVVLEIINERNWFTTG